MTIATKKKKIEKDIPTGRPLSSEEIRSRFAYSEKIEEILLERGYRLVLRRQRQIRRLTAVFSMFKSTAR